MELRNQLRKEWLEKQAKLKNQTLDFDYVYWDGSPHQRELVVKESFPKISRTVLIPNKGTLKV